MFRKVILLKGAPGPADPDFGFLPRVPHIRSDEQTNLVMVDGRPNIVAKAKQHLHQIDQPQFPGQRPIMINAPEIRNYDLPADNAEPFVRLLSNLPTFRPSQYFWMTAVSPKRLMVYADANQQWQLAAALVVCQILPPSMAEALSATAIQAEHIVEALRARIR